MSPLRVFRSSPRPIRATHRTGLVATLMLALASALVVAGPPSGTGSPAAVAATDSDAESSTPQGRLVAPQSARADLSLLDSQLGAYGFLANSVGTTAQATGVGYVATISRNVDTQGLKELDTELKDAVYSAACPRGRYRCRKLSAAKVSQLLTRVRQIAARAAADPNVVGALLTDDFWTDLRYLLPQVYDAFRSAGNTKPVACMIHGFMPSIKSRKTTSLSLRRSLTNYNARWCDAVVFYGFTNKGERRASSNFDWAMPGLFRQGLTGLAARGFDPQQHLLIGMPQTFRYWPRTSRRGTPMKKQYWTGPTPDQLRQQVVAFCAAGARSIMPYAWDDGSRGNVAELHNDPAMRQALVDGVRVCRETYW